MKYNLLGKKMSPVCFLGDSKLLLYKLGKLYIYDFNSLETLCIHDLLNSFRARYITNFCFLNRLLRLGIRCSISISDTSFLFCAEKKIYEYDIKTKRCSWKYTSERGVLTFTEICNIPEFESGIYWGEYFDNKYRTEVNIKRILLSESEEIVYTFPSNTIYHIHNLLPDKNNNCVWIFTGDLDSESGIWKATDNFRKVEPVMVGKQLYRACVAFVVPEGILYATDSPDETNYICLLYKEGETYKVRKIQEIAGPVIYGTRYKDKYCFSTTVEPAIIKKYSKKEYLRYLFTMKKGKGVKDYKSHLYMGTLQEGFADIYSVRKDFLPMGLFQFGAIIFPNTNGFNPDKLVFYQMATSKNNMDTLILDI